MPTRPAATLQPDYRKRTEPGQALGRDSAAIDLLIVAVPVAALLFNLVIGPLTPILVTGTVGAYVLLRYERLPWVFATSWPLLLLPLFCLASILWSEAPQATARYGLLFLISVVAAILIGAGTSRDSALKGLLLAFSTFLFASVVFGRWSNWIDGSYAFSGLAGSKNAAGDAAGIGLLVAATMAGWAYSRRDIRWGLLAAATIPVAVYCLLFAKSTGAWLASAMALSCLIAWIVSRAMAQSTRVLLLGVLLVLGAVILATTPLWMDYVSGALLEASGKGDDLTGRIDLWKVSDEYIARNPVLGIGYNAFWIEGNLAAEALWGLLGLKSGSPFNFHNTPRSIIVELGMVGFALFLLVWLVGVARVMWGACRNPYFISVFFSAMIVFNTPRLYFETLGFANMHTGTMLLFATLAYGYRPIRARISQ